jgi:hypothetical protein
MKFSNLIPPDTFHLLSASGKELIRQIGAALKNRPTASFLKNSYSVHSCRFWDLLM